jgi:hypothetical protein
LAAPTQRFSNLTGQPSIALSPRQGFCTAGFVTTFAGAMLLTRFPDDRGHHNLLIFTAGWYSFRENMTIKSVNSINISPPKNDSHSYY